MRQTNDYLAEGRRQRASRRSSRNNSRSSSRQPSRQRGPKRKPKPASLTNTTGRPVSPLQSPATAAGSYVHRSVATGRRVLQADDAVRWRRHRYPPSVPTTPGLQGPARGFTCVGARRGSRAQAFAPPGAPPRHHVACPHRVACCFTPARGATAIASWMLGRPSRCTRAGMTSGRKAASWRTTGSGRCTWCVPQAAFCSCSPRVACRPLTVCCAPGRVCQRRSQVAHAEEGQKVQGAGRVPPVQEPAAA